MKLKIIAATLAALSAGSAMAGTFIAPAKYSAAKDPCLANQVGNGTTTGNLTTTEAIAAMPLYCRPEVILYIGGASAPALAVTLTTPPSVFQGDPFLIVPKSGSTVHGLNSAALGWYGYGKAGTAIAGKRVYVAYNNKNGSAAGVKQLITKTSLEDEAKMVFPGDDGGCSVVGSGAVAASGSNVAYAGKYECTATASYEAGMAFSDVLPWETEHSELASANNGKVPDLSTGTLLKTDVLALQGFTVVVNLNLYKALQKRDIAAGRLAASCQDVTTQDAAGAICRPNISSIDYASLIRVGGITTAAKFLGDSADTKQITVQRRVDSSGTQAASNLYFLRQNCQGYGTDLAGVVENTVLKNVSVTLAGVKTKGTFGGAMAKRGSGTAAAVAYFKADGTAGSSSDFTLAVKTHGETGGVRTAIKDDTTGYSIGVVSLDGKEDASGFGGNGRYVKLDGADPMLTGTLAAPARDANQRINLVNGRWPFAVEFQAVYRAAATKSVAPNAGNALVDSTRDLVIAGLKKSDASIPGLGFFSSGASDTRNGTDKITTVRRAGGNNCAPLVLN